MSQAKSTGPLLQTLSLKARKIVTGVKSVLVKSILKSLVILSIWLTLSGAIYSRIAHLTINLQESEIYFCNFTNQLSQWFTVTIISQLRWYRRGKANQQLDGDKYFLVYSGWNLESTLLVIPPGFITKTKIKKPKIKKLAKAPTTPPETPPESPTLTYTTDPADTTAVHCSDTFLLVAI